MGSMNRSYVLKVALFASLVAILQAIVFFSIPLDLQIITCVILVFFFVLFAPLLSISRFIQPIAPFALMYMGLGTSALRIITNSSPSRLLIVNNVSALDDTISLLMPVLVDGLLALICFYIGYSVPLNHAGRSETDHEPQISMGVIRHSIVWLSIIGLMAYLFIIETAGGISTFLTDPLARGFYSSNNPGVSGTFYWFLLADFLMLANLLWFNFDSAAFRKPSYLIHLASVSIIRMSIGSRYPVITFWMALFIIYILRRSQRVRPTPPLFSNRSPKKEQTGEIQVRVPFLRTVVIIIVTFAFVLFILTVRTASTTGVFDPNVFQSQLQETFAPKTILQLLSGYDFVDADILMLIQRDFGVTYDYFYGQTFVELILMPIPRFVWPDKPALVASWVGKTFLKSDTTGIPAGITGELYMNFGIIGMFVGMALIGIIFRWIWLKYQYRLTNPYMVFLYAILYARFIPSFTAAGLTNAVIYYASFAIPAAVIFTLASRHRKASERSVEKVAKEKSSTSMTRRT